jgi:spermidine/putrescine transport system substrate-binding protein
VVLAVPAFAQDLLVFDYSGFEDPAFHQPFIDTHGGSPEFVFFGDEDEAFQRLLAGFRSDVTHICAGSVPRWQASGIIEAWDPARITAYDTLNSDLVGAGRARRLGRAVLPADRLRLHRLGYNSDEVPPRTSPASRSSTTPPMRAACRSPTMSMTPTRWPISPPASRTGRMSPMQQFEAATEWLRGIHANLLNYWVDPAEISQLMASGQVLAAWAWNEVPVALADEGFPTGLRAQHGRGHVRLALRLREHGRGRRVRGQAYDYVNALLSDASAGPLLDSGFGSANDAALQALGAEAMEAAGLGEVTVPVLAQLPISNEQRERQAEAFERIKAGF